MQRKSLRSVGRVAILNPDPLLRESAAAEYLGLAPKTLENWRHARHPDRTIPFVQLGGHRGHVFYRQSALDAFIARCERSA